jgi:hypothetical protein
VIPRVGDVEVEGRIVRAVSVARVAANHNEIDAVARQGPE